MGIGGSGRGGAIYNDGGTVTITNPLLRQLVHSGTGRKPEQLRRRDLLTKRNTHGSQQHHHEQHCQHGRGIFY